MHPPTKHAQMTEAPNYSVRMDKLAAWLTKKKVAFTMKQTKAKLYELVNVTIHEDPSSAV